MSWEKLTKLYLREQADDRIYSRGRSYFLEDKVTIIRRTDESIEARVVGNSIYQVTISIEADGYQFDCSCPCDFFCKHMVAVGLKVDASHASKGGPAITPQRAQVRRLPGWEKFVRVVEKPIEDIDQAWQPVFHLELNRNHWTFLVEKAFLRKDRQLGRRSRLKINDIGTDNLILNQKERFVLSYVFAHENHGFGGLNMKYLYTKHVAIRHSLGADCGFLFNLLDESHLYLEKDGHGAIPLKRSETIASIRFKTSVEGRDVVCRPFLIWGDIEEPIDPKHFILTKNPVWILRDTTLIKLQGASNADMLLPFTEPRYILRVPQNEFPSFLQRVATNTDFAKSIDLDDELEIVQINDTPTARLYLHEVDSELQITLKYAYDNLEVSANRNQDINFLTNASARKIIKLIRHTEDEQKMQSLLQHSGAATADYSVFKVDQARAVEWLHLQAPELMAAGFELYGESELKDFRIRRSAPTIHTEVSSSIDWFDLRVSFDFDGILVSLAALKKAVREGKQFITLSDGSTALIPEDLQRKFRQLFLLGDVTDEAIRLSRYHITLIDTLAEIADQRLADKDYLRFISKLRNFQGIEQQTVPETLNGTLRPYQYAGYNWLLFLQEHNFGGFLADDMGLGKTIQAIAILLREKSKNVEEPNLIVAPSSVVFNWSHELQKFAPSLRIFLQIGQNRPRSVAEFKKYDIVLTTYGTLRRDIGFMKDYVYNYAILDESQNIKNPNSQTAKAARIIKSRHRLVLTGTPIENNTLELWSQMSFLNPGILGTQRQFQENFAAPIEKTGSTAAAELLQKLIYPYILRRTKEQVASELPPKTESVCYTNMTDAQAKFYHYWKDYYRATILQELDKKGIDKARFTVLEGLMRLRQIACHPMLVEPETTRDSGKFNALTEQLEEIIAEGHKVLVFSQFVKMLTIMRKKLDESGISYSYLDGRTRDRAKKVNDFQSDENIKVFLISLRAGGVGLNLTAADYVIHFDPWWNPAVEVQATDRAHRIGQDKHVFVYKYITEGTVEEKVLQLQQKKRQLVDQLISTDRAFFKQLTRDDIRTLFD
ncbi:MAG: serine/threonine protein kinase [Calditrichaeota bacterium]|nr:MAG: serine/threonine protein kinase [Calditrichota bacterium]